MKIKLSGKTYESTKVQGRKVRGYLELQQKLKEKEEKGEDAPDFLDLVYTFMADFYDNKFTTDLFEEAEIEDVMDNYRSIGELINKKMQGNVDKFGKN